MITLNNPALPLYNLLPSAMPTSFFPVIAAPNFFNVAFVTGSDNSNFGQISNIVSPTFIQLPPGLMQSYPLNMSNYPVFVSAPNQVPNTCLNPPILQNMPQYAFQSKEDQEFWTLSTEVFNTVWERAVDTIGDLFDEKSIFQGENIELENWKSLIKELVEEDAKSGELEMGIIERLLMNVREESRFIKHLQNKDDQMNFISAIVQEIKSDVPNIPQSESNKNLTGDEYCLEEKTVHTNNQKSLEVRIDTRFIGATQFTQDLFEIDPNIAGSLLEENSTANCDEVAEVAVVIEADQYSAMTQKCKEASSALPRMSKVATSALEYSEDQKCHKENSCHEIVNESDCSYLKCSSKNNTLSTDDSFIKLTRCSKSDNENDVNKKEILTESEDQVSHGKMRKSRGGKNKFLCSSEKSEEPIGEPSARGSQNFSAKNSVFEEDATFESKKESKICTVEEVERTHIDHNKEKMDDESNLEFSDYINIILRGIAESSKSSDKKEEKVENLESKKPKLSKKQKNKLRKKRNTNQNKINNIDHVTTVTNTVSTISNYDSVNMCALPPVIGEDLLVVDEFKRMSLAQGENKYLLEMGFSREELQEIEEINMELEKIMKRTNNDTPADDNKQMVIYETHKESQIFESSFVNDIFDTKSHFESLSLMISGDMQSLVQREEQNEKISMEFDQDTKLNYKQELEMALDAIDLLEELINLKSQEPHPLGKIISDVKANLL